MRLEGLRFALVLACSCGTRPAPLPASIGDRAELQQVPGCPRAAASDPKVSFGAEDMVALCRDLYVEPSATPEDRARIAALYQAARDDVARSLGALQSPAPLAIFCKTDACREYFGGPPKRSWALSPGGRLPGATYRAASRHTILVLRTDAEARGVLAHETVHVEMGFRLRGARVPLWFHEGLAAHVADAPRCSGNEGRGVDDLRRLERNVAWADYTNAPGTIHATYCQARAEVRAWLSRSGPEAIANLVPKVRDGGAFKVAYGAMATQTDGPIPTVVTSSAPSLGIRRDPSL